MPSTTKREGYLLVDHRACPGLGPHNDGTHATLGFATFFEAPTKRCSHCHRQVILNPLRIRAKPYCPKCDDYICDDCEVVRVVSGGECHSLDRLMDEIMEAAARGRPHALLLPKEQPNG